MTFNLPLQWEPEKPLTMACGLLYVTAPKEKPVLEIVDKQCRACDNIRYVLGYHLIRI